ncbi:heme ABC transporter ATP-binding protein/permease CydC [Frischella perrara]|uniref:heme ABC transporter ATP-binding protein/permease CydC n=1 Tax=Frischella perrara TaxID=1267021 RepID=UPI0023F27B3D|nr:cysteine/glutathione ABC transporter ATP-binding protein/permease CydC [Frischella perrara]MCT6874905.1 cysteine/glutathione ABC transporter ATP-binding protein/permease CydC [Frischella perrara]
MLKILFPYIKLYQYYFLRILLGMLMVITALAASIFLLSLSGWFLSATAFVGFAGLYTFNYMLPAAGVRGAAILRTVARYFDRLVNHDTTFRILAFLRTRAFKHLLPLNAVQIQRFEKAELLNTFIADIDNLDHLYLRLFAPIIGSLCITFFIYFAVSYFDHNIALVITLFLLVTILTLPIIFYYAGRTLGEQIAEQKSLYRQKLVSYMQGQAELTLFNAKHSFRQSLTDIESHWLKLQTKQSTLLSLSNAIIVMIVGVMTQIIIWLVADGISNYDQPIIALLIFIGLSSTEILSPIPSAFLFLGQVLSSAKRMNNLLSLSPVIHFGELSNTDNDQQCEITFKNISFSYPNQPLVILKDINFQIKNGEHVALIGQTGCGKSTLLNLITRTWQPTNGTIMLNQIDISQFSEPALRNMMSVVPQVIHIFNDTLRNNLLIGNQYADDAQLISVLKKVELDKLLSTEQGLNLWLGESGRTLSGGERRRIGIARALLHNAPLILLDEPTESLDNQTEQQILSIIKENYVDKTLIMITHRLIHQALFDCTYLLENNTIKKINN